MATIRTWLQTGDFTPKYTGHYYTRKVEFKTPDEFSMLKKFELVESNLGGKSFKCILTLNYDGETLSTWVNEAKAHVGETGGFGKYGKASFSYLNKGQITIEFDSEKTIPDLMYRFNSFFKAELPQHIINKVQTYAETTIIKAPPSYFDLVYKLDIEGVEACWRNGKNKVSDKDINGNDALHIAFYKNNKKLAETALKWSSGIIDSKDSQGKTVLKLAVESGDYEWYKFAVYKSYPSSQTVKDANFDNLLHSAVKGYKGLLDINKNSTGNYNLENSGLSDKAKDFKLIIKDLAHKHHELVKQPNKQGDTPLKIAAETRGDKFVFDTLVSEIRSDYDIRDVLTKTLWDVGAAVDA